MTSGSVRLSAPGTGAAAPGARDSQVLAQAEEFLRAYTSESDMLPDPGRIGAVREHLASRHHYEHTPDELRYGARVAWRNALDCVGRAHWRRLEVIDARDVRTTDDMYEACLNHLRRSTNGGNIQLVMTVFPAQLPGADGFRIWNSQLVRYAGHRTAGGDVVGDPDCLDSTDLAKSLGWAGTGGPFDVLPLMLQAPGGPIRCYELPADAVLQVPILHPDLPGLGELGLRWYAHPAISNQRMEIGGLSYTAAPFSGWYTVPEIAVRAFGDRSRYDLLHRVAAAIGLDTSSDRLLWKERALLELMTAVLHSFDQAGVTIVDHHFAAASLTRHEDRERRQGRDVYGRWRRLIPPSAPSTTETFHRRYAERIVLPNFFPQPVVPPGGAAQPKPEA